VIHDIEGFTGLTAKPLACGIQPAYNGMASAVFSVFPQHLYRALHFPLDKWALHNGRFFWKTKGRFFCLPERSRGSTRRHPGKGIPRDAKNIPEIGSLLFQSGLQFAQG